MVVAANSVVTELDAYQAKHGNMSVYSFSLDYFDHSVEVVKNRDSEV